MVPGGWKDAWTGTDRKQAAAWSDTSLCFGLYLNATISELTRVEKSRRKYYYGNTKHLT